MVFLIRSKSLKFAYYITAYVLIKIILKCNDINYLQDWTTCEDLDDPDKGGMIKGSYVRYESLIYSVINELLLNPIMNKY